MCFISYKDEGETQLVGCWCVKCNYYCVRRTWNTNIFEAMNIRFYLCCSCDELRYGYGLCKLCQKRKDGES